MDVQTNPDQSVVTIKEHNRSSGGLAWAFAAPFGP